jgi:predicted phosphodiesterase
VVAPYKSEAEKDLGAISICYTNGIIQDEERRYLRTLPAHIRLEFQLNEDKLNVLLVHGSPRKINEYLFEDRDEKSLYRIMEQADADVMCFGHTHKPYHRIYQRSWPIRSITSTLSISVQSVSLKTTIPEAAMCF